MNNFIQRIAPTVLTITSPLTRMAPVGGVRQISRMEKRKNTKMISSLKKRKAA